MCQLVNFSGADSFFFFYLWTESGKLVPRVLLHAKLS